MRPCSLNSGPMRKPYLRALIIARRFPTITRVAFIALAALASNLAFGQSLLDRGSYLVNAVMACDGCHTPRGPGGFIMEKRFSGGSQTWDEKAYTVKGSNITPDRETGIGAWSEADLK